MTLSTSQLRPTWDEVPTKNSLMCDPLKGRTDIIAAKKFNIGSKNTYHRAQKVVLSNYLDLISSMDEGKITVHHAAQLAELAPNVVSDLLIKGSEAVIKFLKQKNKHTALNKQKERWLNLAIFQNKKLLKAERDFQLPLRSAFIGLISCCDECGGFHGQPAKLKDQILPYTPCDFEKLLLALDQCGFIKKDELISSHYWRIPFMNKFVHEANHAEVVT